LHEPRRKSFLAIDLLGLRLDDFAGELLHRVADHLLIFGQLELHRPTTCLAITTR
jgi:hypothetical protein